MSWLETIGATDNQTPTYLWFFEGNTERCYRINKILYDKEKQPSSLVLMPGYWMSPVPSYILKTDKYFTFKYPNYDEKLWDGKTFLETLSTRKSNSNIALFKPDGASIVIDVLDALHEYSNYAINQKWKCRYCDHVNSATSNCMGMYYGKLPSGGPLKTNNCAVVEYEYFVSKGGSCQPSLTPFASQPYLGWYDANGRSQFQEHCSRQPVKCLARRCTDFQHTNNSDQVLSFPRTTWTDQMNVKITNTAQFFLPGSLLGHQTTHAEPVCPRCRHDLDGPSSPSPSKYRSNTEHSWWIVESLYWLKVDIYNKKMQHMNSHLSDQRYSQLKYEIETLFDKQIKDFVLFTENGCYQSNKYNNILKRLYDWIQDKKNYDDRFHIGK